MNEAQERKYIEVIANLVEYISYLEEEINDASVIKIHMDDLIQRTKSFRSLVSKDIKKAYRIAGKL